MISSASLYPATTRLGVGLAIFGLFLAVLPRRTQRPLASAVLGVVVAVWLFGATLVSGRGWGWRIDIGAVLVGSAGPVLLAIAVTGVLAAAAALRRLAGGRDHVADLLAGVFTVSFVAWSVAVPYSATAAVVGLAAALGAFALAACPPATGTHDAAGRQASAARERTPWSPVALALGLLSMAGPFLSALLFYTWLWRSPKLPGDPKCGLSESVPVVAVVCIAAPALIAWMRVSVLGRSGEAAAAWALAAGAATAALGLLAFVVWFSHNLCGA